MTAVNLFSLYVVSLDFHLNNLEEKGAKSSEYFQNGITAVITKRLQGGQFNFPQFSATDILAIDTQTFSFL